ncbi:unnamed protein product [Cuscuta epithymum]|uniref:Uncharacterized protein n=1 Tax=Cuscuta epithymum TaxID=186058 RepID=A0AAV0F073_9ASTE|nr:unnamed protein product [Cuscuta epithymum]
MAGFAKAFSAARDAASTAWGSTKQLPNSPTDQPKAGDQTSQTADLQVFLLKPSEEILNGMFSSMVKSGETILENWMKRDGEDVEVFEQFSLLASEIVSSTIFGKNCLETNGKSLDIGKDLLGKLLEADQESEKNKKVSIEEENSNECKAFCFVGYTATTSLLSWTIHMLSRDKSLQEKVRNEVIEIFGCEDLHPEGIAKLTIMDKILEDCERSYPLVPFIRVKVVKGYEEKQPDKDKTNLITSQLFGCDRGTCLGLDFAKIEAKVVLSMILRRVLFSLSPAYIHSPVYSSMITPRHGIRVVLQVQIEESKTMKIVKTVGVVAGVAVAAWGITKLFGSFGPGEPVSKPEQRKKMMKNPGRPHQVIERNGFESAPAVRFKMNRELKKAEKLAKAALGIK